jgi:hypothetical protein
VPSFFVTSAFISSSSPILTFDFGILSLIFASRSFFVVGVTGSSPFSYSVFLIPNKASNISRSFFIAGVVTRPTMALTAAIAKSLIANVIPWIKPPLIIK